jgi:hypothetical protein
MILDHKRDALLDSLKRSAQLRSVLRKQFSLEGEVSVHLAVEGFEAAALACSNPREFLGYGLVDPDPAVAAAAVEVIRSHGIQTRPPPRETSTPPRTGPREPRRQRSPRATPPKREAEVPDIVTPGSDFGEHSPGPADPTQLLSDDRTEAPQPEDGESERLDGSAPSRRERARQRKQAVDLERAVAKLERAETRIAELEDQVGFQLVELRPSRGIPRSQFSSRLARHFGDETTRAVRALAPSRGPPGAGRHID